MDNAIVFQNRQEMKTIANFCGAALHFDLNFNIERLAALIDLCLCRQYNQQFKLNKPHSQIIDVRIHINFFRSVELKLLMHTDFIL